MGHDDNLSAHGRPYRNNFYNTDLVQLISKAK